MRGCRLIAWTIYSDSDEIEEVDVDVIDVVTKSNDLDFEKGVNVCILEKTLECSEPHCIAQANEWR